MNDHKLRQIIEFLDTVKILQDDPRQFYDTGNYLGLADYKVTNALRFALSLSELKKHVPAKGSLRILELGAPLLY